MIFSVLGIGKLLKLHQCRMFVSNEYDDHDVSAI